MNEVSVIVLDLDGGAMLSRCLESILRQSAPPARVIVLDNGSCSPTVVPPGVDLLRSERNRGFTGGINHAMRAVTTPLVAWINNDVVLEPEWVAEMIGAIGSDPGLAGVQSVVLREDGLVDGAGIDVSDGTFRQSGHGEASTGPEGKAWGVSATAALFRTDALRGVALDEEILHPRFFAWYEDVELCARLAENGWRTMVVQRPLARHIGSATAHRIGLRGERLRVRNRYFVNRIHPGVGRRGALLKEDAVRLVRNLLSLRLRHAAVDLAATLEGLFARI